jgi:hypothetical protein
VTLEELIEYATTLPPQQLRELYVAIAAWVVASGASEGETSSISAAAPVARVEDDARQ